MPQNDQKVNPPHAVVCAAATPARENANARAVTRLCVLLPLDGLLAHSDELHYMAWHTVAQELGLPFNRAAYQNLRGCTGMEAAEKFLGGHARGWAGEEKQLLVRRKEDHFHQGLSGLPTNAISADALDLIAACQLDGLPVMLPAAHVSAAALLTRLDLTGLCGLLWRETPDYRPSSFSELLLAAAAASGAAPACCVLVDQAPAALQAAQRAGMRTILVTGGGRAPLLADRNVGSIGAITTGLLREICQKSRPGGYFSLRHRGVPDRRPPRGRSAHPDAA